MKDLTQFTGALVLFTLACGAGYLIIAALGTWVSDYITGNNSMATFLVTWFILLVLAFPTGLLIGLIRRYLHK